MRRRGAILIAVLVCLLVVSALSIQLVRGMILQQRQQRVRQDEVQAYWLAKSACDRAAARLQQDENYAGETWTIDADQLKLSHGALAVIGLEPVEDDPEKRRVIVEATAWAEGERRVTARKELVIVVHNQGDL